MAESFRSETEFLPPDEHEEIAPPEDDSRPWGFRDLLLVLLVAVAALLLSIGICQAIYALLAPYVGWPEFAPEVMQENGLFLIGSQVIWWALVMGYVYMLITRQYGLTFAHAFRLEGKADYRYYIPLGVLLAFAVAIVGGLLPMPESDTPFDELLRDPVNLAVLGVFAVLFAPMLEEVIFRGLLFEPFEARMGSVAAVAITSIPFSLMHGDQYDWRWQNLLLLTVVAAIFGILRTRTRSLWPPILVHTGYNATLVIAALAAAGQQN